MSWPKKTPWVFQRQFCRTATHGELRNASKRMFGCRVGFSMGSSLLGIFRPRHRDDSHDPRGSDRTVNPYPIHSWFFVWQLAGTVHLDKDDYCKLSVNYHTGCRSRIAFHCYKLIWEKSRCSIRSNYFGSLVCLQFLDLCSVRGGEIHTLRSSNMAGKSTCKWRF
jgi:hypothetical protein